MTSLLEKIIVSIVIVLAVFGGVFTLAICIAIGTVFNELMAIIVVAFMMSMVIFFIFD